jgi:ubiquinone/menaquinone biosynthesis C-methylase UbiE
MTRTEWVAEIRRRNAQLQDELLRTVDYDTEWGAIDDVHRDYVDRFLSLLPAGGRVLDAACGTGNYFGFVLRSGRSVVGVDHSEAMLAKAREKLPDVPTEKRDLQDLPYTDEFDGVMCVDAMESLPPEDWPLVMHRFSRSLRP